MKISDRNLRKLIREFVKSDQRPERSGPNSSNTFIVKYGETDYDDDMKIIYYPSGEEAWNMYKELKMYQEKTSLPGNLISLNILDDERDFWEFYKGRNMFVKDQYLQEPGGITTVERYHFYLTEFAG